MFSSLDDISAHGRTRIYSFVIRTHFPLFSALPAWGLSLSSICRIRAEEVFWRRECCMRTCFNMAAWCLKIESGTPGVGTINERGSGKWFPWCLQYLFIIKKISFWGMMYWIPWIIHSAGCNGSLKFNNEIWNQAFWNDPWSLVCWNVFCLFKAVRGRTLYETCIGRLEAAVTL